MLKATCDNCQKDCGPVPIVFDNFMYKYVIGRPRAFSVRDNEDGTHSIACSLKCAKKLTKGTMPNIEKACIKEREAEYGHSR